MTGPIRFVLTRIKMSRPKGGSPHFGKEGVNMARGSGRRPDYTWNGAVVGQSIASGGVSLDSIAIFGIAGTLVRCRGELLASMDSPTDGDKVAVAFGLIKATEEQRGVGSTAVPDPSSDLDADWIWHGFIPLQAQAANLEHSVVGRLTVDSKAMRRFKQTEGIVLIVSNLVSAGTPAIDVTGGFRLLVSQ